MLTFVRSTGKVLLKTALAAVVPFIPALVANPEGAWPIAVLTVALAVVTAAATALVSLPDVSAYGWAAAALAKALRQFGQMVVAATAGALILTDVDWRAVLLAASASALTTLVIAAVEGLPSGNSPTATINLVPSAPNWADEVGSPDIAATPVDPFGIAATQDSGE